MNAPRTLRELLLEASGHGELSTRQLAMKVEAAQKKGVLDARLNRATISNILNGSYKSRPTDETIRAIAYLAGVTDEAAFTAAGRRTPGRPFAEDLPDGVDDLTPKEREAAVYMLRVLVQQRRDLNHHEDQGQANSPHDPPATREARTDGTPMTDEEEFAGEHPDTVAQVHAIRKRMAEHPGEWEGRGAARGDDLGPSDGELRRRPGADAGEENQDPGDDWEGA